MKKLLTLLLLVPIIAFAHDLSFPIVSVIDGDTIKTVLPMPCPLCNVSIRIRDIDTPESTWRGKCDKEKALGLKATEFVKNLAKNQTIMTIRDADWDKYGGRIDAHVFINDVDVGKALLKAGLAKPYDGTGSKPDWCN